jgi:arylamine N-acetyltransferase
MKGTYSHKKCRVHLNTIVTIGDLDYVVDTGHGPSGFPCPVPLIDGDIAEDIRGRQRRMLYDRIPGSTNARQKWWRMQIRYSDLDPWLDVWAFTETEWQVMDFQLLRLGYSKLGTGWVEPTVCCFRTMYDGDTPIGFMLLVEDQIMRGYKGKLEVLEKFYSEWDRISSLEKEFGIVLNEEEQKHIEGHVAEIQDDGFDYYG